MGLLPRIEKNYDNLNMDAKKRATNRAKTAAKAKTKNKDGVCGKGGGLDAYLRWATNVLAGGRFDIYVDSEGRISDKNSPGKGKSAFEEDHHYPTNQIPEGKKNQLPNKKRKLSSRIKKTPTASSHKVYNITPNYSTREITRNRPSTNKTEGSGSNKD